MSSLKTNVPCYMYYVLAVKGVEYLNLMKKGGAGWWAGGEERMESPRGIKLTSSSENCKIRKTSFCSYARPAQPGPNRTRLCGPCIAAITGSSSALVRFGN